MVSGSVLGLIGCSGGVVVFGLLVGINGIMLLGNGGGVEVFGVLI